MKKNKKKEIRDYDETDVTDSIDSSKSLKFEDIGLKLPATPPTQVISIRLPTELLNQIKLYLSELVRKQKRSA